MSNIERVNSKKERLNIKETIYLNHSLESEILKLSEKKGTGFNETIRFLLRKGLECL